MELNKVIDILEEHFPKNAAYDWDNVGLIVGGDNRDIKKVLVTLDTTEEVVAEAAAEGADMIISHHPLIFTGIKNLTGETSQSRTILRAVREGIAVYAAHTNCDVAKDGINARLAEIFELGNCEELEENGLGRIGDLAEPTELYEFAKKVKQRLNTPFVRVGGKNRLIKRVAIGSGACADSIETARQKGADVMITGDVKYHEMLDTVSEGMCVIDAGHYPTEAVVKDIFAQLLENSGVEVIKAQRAEDVFKYV